MTQNVLLLQRRLEKEVKNLKEKLKKDFKSAKDKTNGDLQKMKVSFPTYTIKCVPLYSHSTQCCSHVPIEHHYNYILHFRSNNVNYFASKLPKASSGQEIRAFQKFASFCMLRMSCSSITIWGVPVCSCRGQIYWVIICVILFCI